MKPTRTWILIADGARARVLLNAGPGKGLAPVPKAVFEAPHPPDRDINADRPGRTFDSAGQGRHAMEPQTSPHRANKAAFAKTLADFLTAEKARRAFDRLIIVAPPAALGDLRAKLSKDVQAIVQAELPKDLTNTRDADIAAHLTDVLAV